MLIIDGPDNIGKTTLANRITKIANEKSSYKREDWPFEDIEFKYRHMTRPPEGWYYFHGYKNLALGSHYIVQDRFHLGTLAYDETPKYTSEQLRIIESWVYRTGSLIVVLTPNNYRNYEARLRSSEYGRKEMFDVERILRAATLYEEISTGEFASEHRFEITPTVDHCYGVSFEGDGSFSKWQTEEYWSNVANELIDEWFKRIEWAIEGE